MTNLDPQAPTLLALEAREKAMQRRIVKLEGALRAFLACAQSTNSEQTAAYARATALLKDVQYRSAKT